MNSEYKLTVITPTYNRLNEIKKLYIALNNQTNFEFQWLVVDDGSTDGTKEWFEEIQSTKFEITYCKKENGGKHRALNYSHQFIRGDLVMIVDSDDILTDDAVDVVLKQWNKYDCYNPVLIIMQRGKMQGNHEQFEQRFKGESIVTTLVDLINKGFKGDHCEITTKNEFIKYNFPEFENEKFIGEAWLWQQIGFDGQTVLINKVVYLCEYLDGGLTKSGRKMRLNNPLGGQEHARIFLDKKYSLKIRIKNAILYNVYGSLAGRKHIDNILSSGHPFLIFIILLPSILLKLKWMHTLYN